MMPLTGWTTRTVLDSRSRTRQVMFPRGAKTFYSLGSGFVHGFKWAVDYVEDDSDPIEMTLDAFGAALRMIECAGDPV